MSPASTEVAAAPSGPFASWRFQVFVATWLSYAGFYATRKVFSVVKGPVKQALAVDDLGVSHIFTAYLVCYMLGQFLSATLSRRFENRTLLIAGMATSIACNIAMGALLPMGPGAFDAILVVMGVHGFAQATGWPCTVGMMANWTHRHERGRVMAIWGTCYQLGSVGAKALASFLFGWLGLAWSFWGASLVLVAVLAVFLVFGRESPEKHGLPATEDTTVDPRGTASHHQTARIMTIIVAMGMIYFAFKFLRYAFDSWSVLIISDHFSVDITTAGYLSTAFDWIGFLGVFAAGWASDRLCGGARVPVMCVMTWGCVAASILMWMFGLSSVWWFSILLGLVGFMCMGPDSLLAGSAAMDLGSRRQAALAAGVVNGCGSIGPIFQEPLIGWIKTSFGDDRVLLLLLGMAAVAAVAVTAFWLRLRAAGIRL